MAAVLKGPIKRPLTFKDFIIMATRTKAGVCGRALAGILGSNPAGGMGVWLL